jgi:Mrp family chromosome partitioning ATPase/capsular polysaccharide biosynthesis protein
VEPIDYVRALLRRWPIVAIGALIGAAFAFISTPTSSAQSVVRSEYRATHTMLSTLQSFSSTSAVGTVTFAQVPLFATTGEVPRNVAEALGYNGAPAALAAQMTVETDTSTGTIRFSTVQENPDDAVRIADAFADETVRYLSLRQEELRKANLSEALADVERLEREINNLDAQLAGQINPETGQADAGAEVLRARRDAAVREYSVAYESYRSLADESNAALNITTLERAQPVPLDTGGFTPPQTRSTRVPLAAMIGALLGAGVALVVERLDSRLRDRRRAEDAFGQSVVAELPTLSRKQRADRLVVGPDQHHAVAEAFRSLRTSITFMAAGGQPQSSDDRVGVILVTSPSPAEGKTTTAVNLAAAFAETGRSVLIVNSDFRRPVATAIVIDDRPPLPAGLAGMDRLDAGEFVTGTKIPGVDLLDLSPLGGTPGDLTRATLRLVSALAERVDVVVIDTPPLAVTTEALEFVPVANVVVLVGRMGRTPTTAAERAGELIRFGGAEQIAVALTDTGSARLRRNSYYDYYRDKGDVQTGATSTSRSGSKAAKRRRASSSTRGESAAAATEVTSVTDRLEPVPSGGTTSVPPADVPRR